MSTSGLEINWTAWWTAIASTVTIIMALAQNADAVNATGGDVTLVDGYFIHTFTNSGTLEVTSDGDVEVLVVAGGGGGGGGAMSGGGGAGGLVYTSSYPVVAGNISIVVGSGGLGGYAYNLADQAGTQGDNSSFGTGIVAIGGGGGAGWDNNPATSGGSGGGGNSSQAAALGTAGQGHAGNIGSATSTKRSGGGGGGAGAAGELGVAGAGGAGGDGIEVFGSYYGGGGGGGLEGTSLLADGGGAGGLGGGGAGSRGSTKAMDATPNTGGGGGGAGYSGASTGRIGGNGGSGIVIVRYLGPPSIQNLTATNVTLISAFVNGSLISTGRAPTTVSVYWGDSDGGDPASGLWQSTNTWTEGFWAAGEMPTYQVTSLTANTFYYYCYYATNSLGENWASSSERFLAGNVTVTAADPVATRTPFGPPDTGMVTIQRDPAATSDALTVHYAWSGTAIPDVDFTPSLAGTSVTLPTGVANTNIIITPLWNLSGSTGEKTAILTLLPGAYGIGTPASAAVTIEDFVYTAGTNSSINAGDWNDGAIWSLGRRPLPGDDVTVQTAVTLTNATDDLNSFTLTSGTLTFSNWTTRLSAAEIDLQGGTITHLENTAVAAPWTPDARVWLACSNLTLGAAASITLDYRGYKNNTGFWDGGRGPGGAIAGSGFSGGGGGGHGGRGGGLGDGGPTNGLAYSPENPGSSGGNAGGTSGNGGGALRIDASDTVTVDGTISANGQNSIVGGGAGGAVWITCHRINGTGTIRANGGNCTRSSGGGGGGRIAVIYNTTAQAVLPRPEITYAVAGGTSTGVEDERGDIGTFYFSDTRFLSETITWPGQWIIPGFNEWAPATLTVSNVWTRFPADGFTYQVAGDVTVVGAGGRLDIGGYHYDTYEGRTMSVDALPQQLYTGGNLDLVDGGSLYVYAACTNDAFPDWGALVSVTGTATVASGCRIYANCHDENGGSPLFEVGTLVVAEEGWIDADYRGYRTGQGATYYQNGQGPGGGIGSAHGGGGGGHGGHGGLLGHGGVVNGAAEDAAGPGSGGAYTGGGRGGHGGGAIRVTAAGPITVDGFLSANGRNALHGAQGGGGAGGGIHLVCSYLGGSGIIRADGGNGGTSGTASGGGAGGRIAVYYQPALQGTQPLPDLTFSVRGGSFRFGADMMGELGTLYFPDPRFLDGDMRHSGQWVVPGLTAWSPAHLTLSNTWLRFPQEGFVLDVTGDVVLDGDDACLEVGGDAYDLWEGTRTSSTNPPLLRAGGSLLLTNGAVLYVHAAATNGLPGEALTRVEVGSDLSVASNSWVYPRCHNERGSFPIFEAERLIVACGGGFNADVHGFKSVLGWYKTGLGLGRGQGSTSGSVSGGGGGYGGTGGKSYDAWGQSYGCSNAPLYAGSSGGNRGQTQGGNGGGVICIRVAQEAALRGTLTANGQNSNQGGGGSGGTVFLRAGKVTAAPSASISATGGSATSTTAGAGGGGGRIAVWSGIRPVDEAEILADNIGSIRYPILTGDAAVDYPGAITAAGGSGATASGEDGSIVFLAVAYPPPGTILLLR